MTRDREQREANQTAAPPLRMAARAAPVRPRPVGLRHVLVTGLLLLLGAWGARVLLAGLSTKSALQMRTVSSPALGSGNLAATLRRTGHFQRLPLARRAEASGQSGAVDAYSVEGLAGESLVDLLMIDPQWLARPVSVVSLLIEPDTFAELTRNSMERGREWEKPAHFALVREGKLVFDSPVGLRMHGGGSRRWRANSMRLYFRGTYDSDPFSPAIFPHPSTDAAGELLRQLVVRLDGGTGPEGRHWQFISPLAYDIGRQIGIGAPQTEPVVLIVNGQFLGFRALTEYLDQDYLRARYGHDRFVLVRTKVNRNAPMPLVRAGDSRRYDELLGWLRSAAPMTLAEAEQRVDVDNLSRWFLTVLFCATNDRLQGLLLLDETRSDARWHWLLWDLDMSFGLPHGAGRKFAELDTLASTLNTKPPHRNDPRVLLLRRLFSESPEFRQRFAMLFSEMSNHRLTADFLADRLAFYRRTARNFGIGGRFEPVAKELEAFFAARPGALRQHLARFDFGPVFEVEVRGPLGTEVEIDGHRRPLPYRGHYFAGLPVRVAVLPEQVKSLRQWRIDGRSWGSSGEGVWQRAVTADTLVEVIFEP